MKWLERSAAALLVLTALWIVCGNTFLPMNDAPSHIANGVIAHKTLARDAFFAGHYQFDLVLVPYWATALLLVLGLPVLSPLLAWKLIIALYVVLLPLGCLVLARSVQQGAPKDRVDPPLLPLVVLAVFHWGYWMGESNYLLGQPVALFALCLLIRSERLLSLSFVGFLILAALSYICHIYALTMLLIGATAWALVAGLAHRVPALSPHKLRPVHAAGLMWIYLLFAVAAYFVLFQHGSDANRGSLGFDLSLRRLAHMLIDPFDSPVPPPRLVLGLLYVGLLGTLGWAHRDRLRAIGQRVFGQSQGALLPQLVELVHPALFVPGITLLAAAYLGPVSILAADGTQKEGEIAIRFVLGGFLLLVLSLRLPKLDSLRGPRGVLLAMVMLFAIVQLHSAHRLHRSIDARLVQIDTALLAKIPPHSRVLPLLDISHGEWRDFLVHRIGNYVVLRDSYSPHVFAVRGQHPLRHHPWGDQREVTNLQVTQKEWSFYDYVLLQTDKPQLAQTLTTHLEPVASQDVFQLFRVVRPTPAAGTLSP